MTTADVDALLGRLEAALAARHPEVLARLRKGASETKLRALERKVGQPLPPAFRAFLAWRDGAPDDVRLLDGLVWPGAARIGDLKVMMDEIVDAGHYAAFQPDQWWSKGWVPFADDESGYRSLVLDLHGSFGGRPGQVLRAAAKDPTRLVLAPSFEAWLAAFVAVVEAGALEPEDGGWVFGPRAERVLARHLRGYPRAFDPEPFVAPTGKADALQRPTRGAWPEGVPAEARWLTRAGDDRVEHWLVTTDKTTVTEWAGADPSRLRSKATKARTTAAAASAHDDRLRKQLGAGFCFVRPIERAGRGEAVFAMHVGDGCNAEFLDLSPDGRTLAVGTMLRDAKGANLYLVDIASGRRTRLHTEETSARHPQTFVHRVMFGAGGEHLYYQLDGELRRIPTAGGEPEVIADIHGGRGDAPELFNPHVSRPEFDRSRRRLLCFDHQGVAVRSIEGTVLFRLKVRRGTSEYREAGLSPSGRLVALVHKSRHVIYGHEDARNDRTNQLEAWSVDDGEQVATLPLGEDGYLRRIGFTPDDRQVIVGTYQGFTAFHVATGKRAWAREEREWAYSPDESRLAVCQRSGLTRVLNAGTRRPAFAVEPRSLWATDFAEIQDVQALRFSDDGDLLYEGGSSGRVYVWKT